MICTSCTDHITDGVCFDCHERLKERVETLESAMKEFVDWSEESSIVTADEAGIFINAASLKFKDVLSEKH